MQYLRLFPCASLLPTVASTQTRSATRYDVDRTPFVEFGGDGIRDTPLLGSVFSATKTARGFVVADTREHALWFFDDRGTLVRQAGREGQGPGEFMGGLFVNQCAGDSLFVWDSRLARISVFTASGTYVRQIPFTGSRLTCSAIGVLAMLLRPSGPAPDAMSSGARMSSITLRNAGGDSIGGIAGVSWGETRTFGALTTIHMRGHQLYVGTGRGPIIEVYDVRGRPIRQIKFAHQPVRISTDAHERAIEGMLDVMRAQGVENLREQRAALLARPIPEVYPPYFSFEVAPNGTIWLLVTHHTDPMTQLKAVDDDGAIVAEVHLRLGDTVRLLEAGDDYLLLSYVNAEGVVKVGAFRVRERAG